MVKNGWRSWGLGLEGEVEVGYVGRSYEDERMRSLLSMF